MGQVKLKLTLPTANTLDQGHPWEPMIGAPLTLPHHLEPESSLEPMTESPGDSGIMSPMSQFSTWSPMPSQVALNQEYPSGQMTEIHIGDSSFEVRTESSGSGSEISSTNNHHHQNFDQVHQIYQTLDTDAIAMLDSALAKVSAQENSTIPAISSSTSASSLPTSVDSIISPRRKQNRTSRNRIHALYDELCSGKSDTLKWENEDEGIFKVVNKAKLVALWTRDKKRGNVGNTNKKYNNIV